MGLSVACPETRQHKMPQVILVPKGEVQVPKVELPEGDLHRITGRGEQGDSANCNAAACSMQHKKVLQGMSSQPLIACMRIWQGGRELDGGYTGTRC